MNVAWYIAGAAVVGGLGFYLYEKKKNTSTQINTTSAASGTPVAALVACSNANTFAALAAADTANASAFRGAYDSWAAQCRAAGGTPNPFPT